MHFFPKLSKKNWNSLASGGKVIALFWGGMQEEKRMPTPPAHEQAWPAKQLQPPAQSAPVALSPHSVSPVPLHPLPLPSRFLSSFPLLSEWKGYSSLLDILLDCEYTSIDLPLEEGKEKGGWAKKKKNTVTHSLISWLPRGHVQAMAENFNCVSPPAPLASASYQLLLWLHPVRAHFREASSTEGTARRPSSAYVLRCCGHWPFVWGSRPKEVFLQDRRSGEAEAGGFDSKGWPLRLHDSDFRGCACCSF